MDISIQDWDTDTSIVFCPSVQQIAESRTTLPAAIAVGKRMRTTITQRRDGGDCLDVAALDLFVLHPAGFIPHNELLNICIHPPYLDAEHNTITTASTREPYRYDATTSKLVRASGDPTPLRVTIRHGELSTVTVILNAGSKIEHAQKKGWQLSSEVVGLKQAIKLEFYFRPTLNAAVAASDEDGRSALTPDNMDIDGLDMRSDRGGAEHEGSEDDGSEYEEEDDNEALQWPLSPEEYMLGAKKVTDPAVPIEDRMVIGSLLFTKRYLSAPVWPQAANR
ncbi:hypothetical protein B0H17DRAFT_1192084 [Mycena rosella]|uniref:Uncharacterized protein n=1 Tax=Mycena rosella TaxID=1033263 RepID=A0AAD7GY49_MYCRO|nr:hypothetical protein B0H17DRAFT_1192084 [Mycena rosella]